MFRFEHSEFLWALLIVPILIVVYFYLRSWRKQSLKNLSENHLLRSIIPLRSSGKFGIKYFTYLLALALLIIGMANPQIGSKLQEVKRKGVDVMVALDLSNSMLAEDIKPNRLESAKRAISKFIEKLRNDRIGLVVFGGQAYTQLPITTDFAAAKLFLSTINTQMIPTQGTAIGAAIEQCLTAFNFESPTSKVIVVITDGENHEDDAASIAADAAEKDVVVHTIGMGSTNGAPIPVYSGNNQIGFRKDTQGNTVVTKLNEEMLKEIASAGNGIYVRASSSVSGLEYVLEEIDSMEKTEFGTKVYTDYEDRYQYFIGAAILLLVFEFFLSERKNKWLNKERLFGVSE